MNLTDANKAIEASIKKADELGVKVTIVVSDTNGVVVSAQRMDGAFTVSPIFAHAKAVTSGTLGLPTSGIGEYAQPNKPLLWSNKFKPWQIYYYSRRFTNKRGRTACRWYWSWWILRVFTQDEQIAQAGLNAIS